MRISVEYGHGTGADRGADGYLNEEKVIREYGPMLVDRLRSAGHIVYDVTPTQAGLTLAQSLAYRVNMSNSLKVDLHLSLHVNAYIKDKAQGCEVEYGSAKGKVYADRISAEISKALNVTNRGGKDGSSLYVVKYTNAVAVLIEPFFCDTKTDCNKYNATLLANAIIKGILGSVTVQAPVAKPVVVTPPPIVKYDTTPVSSGSGIFAIPNTNFYIEQRTDGNMGIHVDRGNYIVLKKGAPPTVYYNDNNGKSGSKDI